MGIQVQNIQKKFGHVIALDDVTLDFPAGKLTALLGPSGCGKTTLLRIIAGLEMADGGSILFEGQDVSDLHARERQIGFVFQHYALFRHMTVFENIAFGLRVKPRKKRLSETAIQHRVYELLSLVRLDFLQDKYPDQLSGGQRQRVALARALAVEPHFLLLDEPFGALDANTRKELRRWLNKLQDELQMTIILVTHDQEEALEVSDVVVLINHGRVEQVGIPMEVYEQPATPFVCRFLGEINLFQGRIKNDQLEIGGSVLPMEVGSYALKEDIVGFTRPHEMMIMVHDSTGKCIQAKIIRILYRGLNAHINLVGVETTRSTYYQVELPRKQVKLLGLKEGQYVWLKPEQIHVF